MPIETDKVAIVISHFGNEVLLGNASGDRFRARVSQGLPPLVCGDKVQWQENELNERLVTVLHQRHGVLTRSTQYADEKLIAANVDLAFIVVSHKPVFKTGLLDRYLAACELAEIDAVILFNKVDTCNSEELDDYRKQLRVYEKISYSVLYISAKQHIGFDDIRHISHGETGVLVGQSGVGKSSILRALFPGLDIKIGKISDKTNKGRHTTTYSELYTLDAESCLIDSPGIREFGLNTIEPVLLCTGFREFKPYLDRCRFRDCKHVNEPGCGVKQAVNDGEVSQARWDSYKSILATISG